MSLEDATMVLDNISEVLIISYPIILIVLFFWLVLLGRFIKPISSIINTSNDITKTTLLRACIPRYDG
jgi:hypothetical protein